MKKLIPLMIAAVMLCVVFTAVDVDVDAKSDPHLWVGKTEVTGDVDLPTWSYKKSTNTITFNNYVQTGDDVHEYRLSKSAAIYYDGDKTLKFVIKGTNKIDANAIDGIVAKGNGGLEFSGNGKLTITNTERYHSAVSSQYGLTINGGEYKLESKHNTVDMLSTIYTAFEPFVVNKGTVICSEMIHCDGAEIKGGFIGFLSKSAGDTVFYSFDGGLEIEGEPYTENFDYGSRECTAKHDGDVYISYTGGKIVTFDANGGTCPTPSKTTDAMGNIDSFPDAERDGWVFAGWYTAKEGGERVISTHFTKDTTVYAHWVNAHIIHFDAQGGVAEVRFEVTNIDGTLRMIPDATKDGWRFGGWYTEPEGEGERVTKSTVFHENATVYAFWTNTQLIFFNAQGGDAQVWFEVTNTDGTLRMVPTAEREGYFFEGWYTEPYGGDRITAETVFHTDAMAYAHWKMDITIGCIAAGITAALALVIVAVSVLFVRRR